MKKASWLLLGAIFAMSAHANDISEKQKSVMTKLMEDYAAQDKAVAERTKRPQIKVSEFSAETGKQLFMKTRNWEGEEAPSCSACHTEDPRQIGKHKASKKVIKPLAPVANSDRFTNVEKVETNFGKHCREIYSRDCDPAEKGHYLASLMSVR